MTTRAAFWRRTVVVVEHGLLATCITAALLFAGILDSTPFVAPAEWFLTEWLLKWWLDDPVAIVRPVALIAIIGVVSCEICAFFEIDPLANMLKLRVVEPSGIHPPSWRFGLRVLGDLLGIATLGLGYLWALVSRDGRTWGDLLSGTAVVATKRR